jgi:hypothetical protein
MVISSVIVELKNNFSEIAFVSIIRDGEYCDMMGESRNSILRKVIHC